MGFGQFAFLSWRAWALQRIPLQIRGSLVQLGGLFGDGEVPAPPIAAVILDALDSHHSQATISQEPAQPGSIYWRPVSMSQVGKHWRTVCDLMPKILSVSPESLVMGGSARVNSMRPVNERFLEGVVQPRQ